MIKTQTIKSRTFDNVISFNRWDVKGIIPLDSTQEDRLTGFVHDIKDASGYPDPAGERYLTGDYVQALLVKHRLVVDNRAKIAPAMLDEEIGKIGQIIADIQTRLEE